MQTSSQFRKPSSPLKPKHPKYITSQQCTPIDCTRQEVGSSHSLETTSHSLQQTYLRLLIHTTQNFKWSRYTLTNTKHITIASIYIPPRDTSSTHYKTADTDIQYITNIPHSVLTGDVNAHSTLWHSYTDDHRGQLIADVISNSDHITRNTNTPTRVPNTTLQQTSSPRCLTHRTTQHALSSDHLPIITTINTRHDYRLQQNRRTFTNDKKADWTQFTEVRFRSDHHTHQNIHTANRIFTNIILMADKQNIPKGKMHSNCRLLHEDIVCKITQRNNIRRSNTCDPALKLLNEEITSDIQKHKQNIWKEHLDAHWDHRHNMHTLW